MKFYWKYIVSLLYLLFIPSSAYAQFPEFGDIVSYSLIAVIGLIITFLIFREVFCWYMKINQEVALLKEIDGLLKKIENMK